MANHDERRVADDFPYEGTERRRGFPSDRELLGVFHELMAPHLEESNRIGLLQLKASQRAEQALFMMTGDGSVKGQLQLILEELEDGKRRDSELGSRQKKIMRRVVSLERQRADDHTQNRLERELDRAKQERAIAGLRRDLRSIRRSQLWVVRYTRGFYDWCTTKDETGRFSRARVVTFLGFLVTVEEGLRRYVPLILHKIAAFLHAARL